MERDVSAMDTTIAYITSAQPASITLNLTNQQITPPSGQDCETQICVGTPQTTNIDINIRIEAIKNAQCQPVVPNPSPVRVESYTVAYSIPSGQRCARGSHSYGVDQTVSPDSSVSITVNLVPPGGFNYCNNSLYGVPFLRAQAVCPQDSYVEFKLVEVYTGRTRTLTWRPQVILTGNCQ